jgi:sulfotransferase family protein
VKPILARLERVAREAVRLARVPFLGARRLDLCCCGLSKSGTHSIAGIFEGYRSVHHPDSAVRLELAIRYVEGQLDRARAARTLRWRDRHLLRLEVESSSIAGTLIEPLVDACPEKKFLLTIRGVEAWCDSWIDHKINSPPTASSRFAALDRAKLRAEDFTPTRHDAPFLARGLLPLACYFQLWTRHNARVLQTVPEERLLVVPTEEIGERISEIALFAGVPPSTLRPERAWLFKTPKKHRLLATLDPSYVTDTAERLCGALTERYLRAPNAAMCRSSS